MKATCRRLSLVGLLVILAAATTLEAQSTTGGIQGTVKDKQDAVVPGAAVTIRNVQTNASRTAVTDGNGGYRFLNVPVGDYELTVELSGFSKHVRSGLTLSLNQDAVVDVQIQPAGVSENVEVRADAPLLNTTNAEVGVRFDTTRISELPMMNSRDIFALALSAPGVSQLGSGQSEFATGDELLVERHAPALEQLHGRRPGQQRPERHRPAAADQQHGHHPGSPAHHEPVRGGVRPRRRVGRQRGHPERDERVQRVRVRVPQRRQPERAEQSGQGVAGPDHGAVQAKNGSSAGRVGGPVLRDRTFFFGSFQRWTDRRLGSGFTLNGAPTDAGRQILQSAAGSRPQVQALLKFLPAAQAATGKTRQLHGRGADLHRAARVVDRLVVGRLRQQPDVGPRRSSARAEPHADRPIPADRYCRKTPAPGRSRRRV